MLRRRHGRPSVSMLLAMVLTFLLAQVVQASGPFKEYTIPTKNSYPVGITVGADQAIWFTESGGNKIGRLKHGVITEYVLGSSSSGIIPTTIVSGPDGALWFTESGGNKIGRITTSGVLSEYPLAATNSDPDAITVGPDGALWFAEINTNVIGRITTAGVITNEYPISSPNSNVYSMVTGPDGNLWFVEYLTNNIGRITTSGVVTEYPIPTAVSFPNSITVGSDGALWFAEQSGNKIGRITTAGSMTEYALASGTGSFVITTGHDGNLWFGGNNNIVSMSTAGVVLNQYTIPTAGGSAYGITAGYATNIGFTEYGANKIGNLMVP